IAFASDGKLFASHSGEVQIIASGKPISAGETIYTNESDGAGIVLEDGTRVELHSEVELRVQHKPDGLLLRLEHGSIIVNAAPQRRGHLYVQTRDCLASVTGTIFAVSAVEAGSRVSVLEGEVHVVQGSTINVLLRGQQISTNPVMLPVPMESEIEW